MLKSHEKFHSANGKRLILIADDEQINRELLGMLLGDDYELIYAADGQETIDLMRKTQDTLALVLLDLRMPVMSGAEVLKTIRDDSALRKIPVIVLTSDQAAEVESLNLGAIDFIPKPYPQADVIRARIRRTIELSEDREIISSTERDPLTGLYNREYFYRYAEQFDQHHKNVDMDAIVIDVNHFHIINERFGTAYGDDVLRNIGEHVREIVRESGGIVCRREADTFMVYCPHGMDYDRILDYAYAELAEEENQNNQNNRVRLRMGVYENVDKSLDVERRFDRAKMAADTVQGSFTRTIGMYDSMLHEKELYAEQLIEAFPAAIRDGQFEVYYQPKFDVRTEIPVLASAEALVRWNHPKMGMISPGVFIPLFEENGLIQMLDTYVWRTAAAQIRQWEKKFDFTVPVSVNVSRVDMYDPDLINILQEILVENQLSADEILLEITESAYTQDTGQIIDTVNKMRGMGFRIEMDDFGTGYSSLNMISTLPIDALKLDMQFIRNAFNNRKDTRMLEVIIDIADYLSVPVIAEGVETAEQLNALKAMGCDFVQGYYFSKPVPAADYEQFVIERKKLLGIQPLTSEGTDRKPSADRREGLKGRGRHALSGGYEKICYVDLETNRYLQFSPHGKEEDLQIEDSGEDFFVDLERYIGQNVFEEDRQRLLLAMQKKALLSQMPKSQPFSITYRCVRPGGLAYYSLKAVRSEAHDDHHIVVGISNVDLRIRQTVNVRAPQNEIDFGSLAQVLQRDTERVCYVDTDTDEYQEYLVKHSQNTLKQEGSGSSFFDAARKYVREMVYADDQERVGAALEKETLLHFLHEHGSFCMQFRMVTDGMPVFYKISVSPADGEDHHHIIFSMTNIDRVISEEARLEAQRQSMVTYASIVKALATDYICIYYVNTDTDQFIEYSAQEQYEKLEIEKSGENFFEFSRKNIVRIAHPDDVDMFLHAFTKENILAGLSHHHNYTLTYRLLFDRTPVYVHMKISRMEDENDHHIVVGVSNVDAQIRREQEHARALRLANYDALTGIKSKHAYSEEERKIDRQISLGGQDAFGIVMCDVNGLKQINDARGHKMGDQFLKDACKIICTIFRHSPVYRVGGDEFAVLLRNGDYTIRAKLMRMLEKRNEKAEQQLKLLQEKGVDMITGTLQHPECIMIAGGLSIYRPGEDKCASEVFERADLAMYENKKMLKSEL